jgi:hypothetical protein
MTVSYFYFPVTALIRVRRVQLQIQQKEWNEKKIEAN